MPAVQLQSAGAPIALSSPNSSPPTIFGFRVRRQPQSEQPLPEPGVPPAEEESSGEDEGAPSSEEEGAPSSEEEGASSSDEEEDVGANQPSPEGNAAAAGTAALSGPGDTGGTVEGGSAVSATPPASNRLGVGPIVGIVFGIFALLVFVGLFCYRRRMIRKRKALRGKWAVKPFDTGSPGDFRTGDDENMMEASQNMGQVSSIATLPSPNIGGGGIDVPPLVSTPPPGGMRKIAPEVKLVIQPYIPGRPDELEVALGDRLRVLKQYDDGWALCVNMSASLDADPDRRKGMVPTACWDVATGGADADEKIGRVGDDEKLSRRGSSLPDGSGK